jgi:putative membrane protein
MTKLPALTLLALLAACSDPAGNSASDKIKVTGASTVRQPGPAPAETRGQDFVSAVEGGFQFVLESTRLAEQKAGQSKVKQFAQKLRSSVTSARSELESIAAASRLQLAPRPGETHQSDLAVLSSTEGAPLDRAFAEQQVEALTALVGLIRAYSDGGDNPRLKDWAAKSQTVINDHLLDVQTLRAELEEAALPPDQR